MDISLFDYDLPERLIAQSPLANRSQSRLLNVGDQLDDLIFKDFIDLLHPTDLLITNNTKVIAARLFGHKPTGGKIEIMLERVLDQHTALAQLKSSKSLKPGQQINIDENVSATVIEPEGVFFKLRFNGLNIDQIIVQYGHLPLPPYIKRQADQKDNARYQTVYAKQSGAVAAPTAGLHFDDALLNAIDVRGISRFEVTLHVGAGTFQPVRSSDLTQHRMHKEYYQINQPVIEQIHKTKSAGGRIVAIGTTTVRALESAYQNNQLIKQVADDTDIFIYPGFEFKVVDAMLTNFHLPKSTLLMMVSAFAGYDKIKQAYQHAIKSNYRFFSYGDAMFLNKA